MYIYVYMHVYTNTYVYSYMYIFLYIHILIYSHVLMCLNIYTYIYISIYIYIHIYQSCTTGLAGSNFMLVVAAAFAGDLPVATFEATSGACSHAPRQIYTDKPSYTNTHRHQHTHIHTHYVNIYGHDTHNKCMHACVQVDACASLL